MAAVKDKASTGRDHLRYMLSSWFELSKDAETETGPNSASMVGQAKPETQVREKNEHYNTRYIPGTWYSVRKRKETCGYCCQ